MKYLANKYEYFLFDQWGVLHDGDKIFSFTNKTLKTIKDKYLILISNTSQTVAEFKKQTLKKINLNFLYFNKIITAGETLINISKKSQNSLIYKIVSKKNAFIISNGNEKELIKKLRIKNSDTSDCKFILSLSLKPKKNLKILLKKIKYLSKRKIPMICTNPDIYTFQNKKRYYQIGYIAEKYSSYGGKVYYIGKPHISIFNNLIKKNKKKKTIIIGDNLKTDILGGKNYKISTALALDGFKKLHKLQSTSEALTKISTTKIKPDYFINNISII